MASTNLVKWNDTDNRLTAYCNDDTGDTEIGPVKWDDANNKLELNCNSTDFQVKWDDGGDNLEARSVDDECCEEDCEFPCTAPDCDNCPPRCFNAYESGPDEFACMTYGGNCCWMGTIGTSTIKLKYYSGSWHYWHCDSANTDDSCGVDNPGEPVFCIEWTLDSFDCDTGGAFHTATNTVTIIPDSECDDFYDYACF